MKKVLFTATVDSHILNFHIPYIKMFHDQGYEVHIASNGNTKIPYATKKFNIPFERKPFKLANLKAYANLKSIINENNYVLIHCHTPVGSVLTRLAAKSVRKNGTRVLYTAHGFHFFKGASLKNWLIFYPVERWLSKYTDCLITINEEDYQLAKNKFSPKSIEKINGVGINLIKFKPPKFEEKLELRKKYNYGEKDFILIFTAEMSYRKHQDLLIETVNLIRSKIPNLKLLLAGTGDLLKEYQQRVKNLGLENYIHFLGYREDINNLLKLSDVAVSSARQEGLPVNIMEAMATGLPAIVTNCRGNRDLIKDGRNGFVIEMDNIEAFGDAIIKLFLSNLTRREFGKNSLDIIDNYSLTNVSSKMKQIYKRNLNLHV